MKDRRRLAILLSGRGSNFEAIADAVDRGLDHGCGDCPVISDVLGSRGVAGKSRRRSWKASGQRWHAIGNVRRGAKRVVEPVPA